MKISLISSLNFPSIESQHKHLSNKIWIQLSNSKGNKLKALDVFTLPIWHTKVCSVSSHVCPAGCFPLGCPSDGCFWRRAVKWTAQEKSRCVVTDRRPRSPHHTTGWAPGVRRTSLTGCRPLMWRRHGLLHYEGSAGQPWQVDKTWQHRSSWCISWIALVSQKWETVLGHLEHQVPSNSVSLYPWKYHSITIYHQKSLKPPKFLCKCEHGSVHS